MKFKYWNDQDVFETNVSLFEGEVSEVFVDYDSDRFRLILNHFRKVGHAIYPSLEYDLNRMEEAIGCESRIVRIGGKSFQLGKGTFEKIPFLKGKTSFESLKGGEEGEEIDMDPIIFRRIISYLRNPKCRSLTEEMKTEMNYYGIELPKEGRDYRKTLEENMFGQIITFSNYQERKVTNWTEQHFGGRPDFGRRVSCHIYPQGAFESLVYLSVTTCLGQLLEVDQIINRIDFEIRGRTINNLYGKIMKFNQLSGLAPPMITRQDPDREFYLIPINLLGENSWVDYPMMDEIRITVEFCSYDDYHCKMDQALFFINYQTDLVKKKPLKGSIKDYPFLLNAENVKEIPCKCLEYHGPEFLSIGKHLISMRFPGEIDGIFMVFEPNEENDQTGDGLSGQIKLNNQRKYFDQTTNILDQTTQFGTFHPEIFYIHLEINLNRIDLPIIELNQIRQEGILHCWVYRKMILPIACDQEGVAQTIENRAIMRNLSSYF